MTKKELPKLFVTALLIGSFAFTASSCTKRATEPTGGGAPVNAPYQQEQDGKMMQPTTQEMPQKSGGETGTP